MIKIKQGTEPNEDLVSKIIVRFKNKYIPRFRRLEEYYQVKNKISTRSLPNDKPNNRISHGFAKYITNMATGYFMGEGIRLEVANDQDNEYREDLIDVLDKNSSKDVNFEIAKEMSKKGIAFELLYMNEQAEIRFRKFGAEEIIPIYSQSVGEFLEFAIRIWDDEDLESGKTISYAEVYTNTEIITYRKEENKYKEIHRNTHLFDDVPVIVYWNNEEQKGDYEDIIALIDAYDKAQSDTANDFEYFTDAYLVIVGAAGGLVKQEDGDNNEHDAVRTLKQERLLFLDDKGQAEWLIKEINDTAVENFKNRIYSDIFFLAQVPALTDESFAGNLTGVAIKYKLIGLEQLAVIKENKFLASYRKKLKLITRQLNLKLNKNYEAHLVNMIFDRNMVQNLLEAAQIAQLLQGIVSKETQLSVLPIVKDSKQEVGKIQKEGLDEEYGSAFTKEQIETLGGGD